MNAEPSGWNWETRVGILFHSFSPQRSLHFQRNKKSQWRKLSHVKLEIIEINSPSIRIGTLNEDGSAVWQFAQNIPPECTPEKLWWDGPQRHVDCPGSISLLESGVSRSCSRWQWEQTARIWSLSGEFNPRLHPAPRTVRWSVMGFYWALLLNLKVNWELGNQISSMWNFLIVTITPRSCKRIALFLEITRLRIQSMGHIISLLLPVIEGK